MDQIPLAQPVRRLPGLSAALLAIVSCLASPARADEPLTTVKVGYCVDGVLPELAPLAVAVKLGWFGEAGLGVEVAHLPGGPAACAAALSRREIDYALSDASGLAALRTKGLKAKVFYTIDQESTYRIMTPANGPIADFRGLTGKRIGVSPMAMSGPSDSLISFTAAESGMVPGRDLAIERDGEDALELLRSGEIDALLLLDVEVPRLDDFSLAVRDISGRTAGRFPSVGFLALDQTLNARRAEAVGFARAFAKGTIFATANPDAACDILEEVAAEFETVMDARPISRAQLSARLARMKIPAGEASRWGESVMVSYVQYLIYLQRQVAPGSVANVNLVVTNDLIAEVNAFDAQPIAELARQYR